MKIKITETKEVEATPRILAQAFWGLDNGAQAEFFDHLANLAGENLAPQMEVIACYTDNLSLSAITAMAEIGREAQNRLDGELLKNEVTK